MKALFLIIFFIYQNSLAQEFISIDKPQPEFHFCRFKSESHTVEHLIKINFEEISRLNCEYSIVVDEKIFKTYKADLKACHDFIRIQINKGSVCINNIF